MHESVRIPARAGSFLQRGALLVVMLAVLLATSAAVMPIVSPSAETLKPVCRQAGVIAHHRIAAHHCRGTSPRPNGDARTGGGQRSYRGSSNPQVRAAMILHVDGASLSRPTVGKPPVDDAGPLP
ncbi:hypothetical protein [Streptomyces sp. NRRL WC-3742]|uniref:hypothetical protein n=1 Tax=Streptomyces sp. NRRL WC-3742 TaxID=1463934 RepID=UPI0004C4BFDF|nr:hypothetical protein [Streptomyces sp. NRRL WC-3742]